jgi:hypothetical protein
MDIEMEMTMRNAEGRYISAEESRRMLEIAATFARRLAVSSALEAKEREITRETTELMLKQFPSFKERHMAAEKTQRDLALTLRYISHAILRNDPDFLREKVLYWVQGVFVSKSFGEVVRATYVILKKVVDKELGPEHAPEVNRFIDFCIESTQRYQDQAGAAA